VENIISNFSNITSRLIVILLSISIIFTGCHSYYTIPKEDYNKISTMEDIKIVYTNGKEFIVENNDTTEAKIVGDSLIVYHGVEKNLIAMNEISKIKENRFDLGGTITLTLLGLMILVIVFYSTYDVGG
jgi:hypothetical protein